MITLPIEGNDLLDTEANWTLFKNLLVATGREGAEDLLKILEKTDFKTAPASHKFHLHVKGGLCQHSLNVYKYALELDKMIGTNIPVESLTIAALLHDLCKIHFYKIGSEFDREYKDKTNNWRKKEVYVVDDKFPVGHGEKSVILAQQYGIKLKVEEVLAIRHHMGFSDPSSQSFPFKQAWGEAFVILIAMADQSAVIYEDHVWTKEHKVS